MPPGLLASGRREWGVWPATAPRACVTARAAARSGIFILKMLPFRLRPIDWLTHRPLIETLSYPGPDGPIQAELWRSPSRGRHPGIVLSLGVLPLGVVDPRAAMVAEASTCAGFATLLHWSPAVGRGPADVAGLRAVDRRLAGAR